jgi:hypothetical protein
MAKAQCTVVNPGITLERWWAFSLGPAARVSSGHPSYLWPIRIKVRRQCGLRFPEFEAPCGADCQK